ncbi:hypothetical protein GCM10025864_35070 [Luteimicrobium album]|uniref:PKD domain-containing protein n=1 Tax=Luteimicrobium album TaxID=1054550 RepID=A0ABQ6I704_9MICO|nr:hypothetical protein GCM10025864_35070 [Luteimicrobium album]
MRRAIVLLLAGVALTVLVQNGATASEFDGSGLTSKADGNKFDFNRYLGGAIAYDGAVVGLPTKRYERKPAVLCHEGDVGDVEGCAWLIQKVADANCPKGSLPLDPLYVASREVVDGEPTAWSGWELVDNAALCLNPADLKAEATTAFKSLTVKPSAIKVQPAGGQVLINMPTITYTDAVAETFDISLGEGDQKIPVQVEAVPKTFTWSYGSEEGDEGFPLTTTDPGKPYPDQSVTHTYTHKGPATLDLTTTWTGRFRIQGIPGDLADPDTWTTIDGQATTTSPTVHLNVYEKRPHLVEDTLG